MSYLPQIGFPPSYFPPTYFAGFGDARAASPPNPRRTLAVVAPGFAGIFTAYTFDTDDVATFDLSGWLSSLGNPGETITAVLIELDVVNKDGTADPSPLDRETGLLTIQGAFASQRFGNWQVGIPYIMYRCKAVAHTSFANTIAFWAYIPVYDPIA